MYYYPKITSQEKCVTYGFDSFVWFPIISTKLLSQSFFLSKSNFSTDIMIYENEMENGRAYKAKPKKKKEWEEEREKRKKVEHWKIKHNEPDTLQSEKRLVIVWLDGMWYVVWNRSIPR